MSKEGGTKKGQSRHNGGGRRHEQASKGNRAPARDRKNKCEMSNEARRQSGMKEGKGVSERITRAAVESVKTVRKRTY